MFGKNNTKLLLVIVFFALTLGVSIQTADGETTTVKDTDFDGIPDTTEIQVYKTNPNLSDTDNDGVLDFQEILSKSDPLDKSSTPLVKYQPRGIDLLDKTQPRMWYVGRIAGIASFIMFTLVICMGLVMTSKALLKVKVLSAPNALELHSFNATFIAFTLLLVHIGSFMFDDILRLTLAEAIIPFLLKRNITTVTGYNLSVSVGLGIIAFYLAIILIVTSRLRNKLISVKKWRVVHYSSFLFYIFFLTHAYSTGSDSNENWMKTIYITSITLVSVLVLLRIFARKYFMKINVPLQNQMNNTTIKV